MKKTITIIWFTILILTYIIGMISCSKTESIAPKPVLGKEYQGGIVFYILSPLDKGYANSEIHGFIAAKEDIKGLYQWGCQNVPYNELKWDIGYGKENTNIIALYCLSPNAANICKSLSINGYKDWYLPNAKELNLMYDNRNFLPNLSNSYYWSSNKATYTEADAVRFSDGDYDYFPITSTFNIRPIRSF